ncbi:MAG: class I SAM-dependent methyltransferase [Solirubrobacteraceae bacterium]
MSTSPETGTTEAVIARRAACGICGSATDRVIELPGLPLTGMYSPQPPTGPTEGFDNALLVCPKCGLGQLENVLDPARLYDRTYDFRTSLSATAKAGTEFFLRFLDEVAPGRSFRCAVDVGCNDLYLLELLEGRTSARVGIDPIWEGREGEAASEGIRVIGAMFEDTDPSDLPEPPDLVCCRHTLEHIVDPLATVERLIAAAAPDALFVFEVPGFEGLVRKHRFDQVFHQHLNYLNFASFQCLIARAGGRFVASRENYHDWSALAVAFTAGSDNPDPAPVPYSPDEIASHYSTFCGQMVSTRALIDDFIDEGPLYGYGAAQMLPVLAWHLGPDLAEKLELVLDDDPAKDGAWYRNLPLQIRGSDAVADWSAATVLVTAVDNAKPILTRLLNERRPRHLIHPLNVI